MPLLFTYRKEKLWTTISKMLFFKMILHGFITELNNCFASLSELVLHGENIF